MVDRTPHRDNQGNSQNRNYNLRRNPPLIKQREQRGPNDQQIRPPFQENYVKEEVEPEQDLEENLINLFRETKIDHIFFTKEEQDQFLLSQSEAISLESEEYTRLSKFHNGSA